MVSVRSPQTLRTIPFLMAICFLGLPVYAKYSGGTGEPNNPYQIATAADLIALGNEPNDYGKHFVMTADINLDPNLPGRKVFDKAVIAPDRDPNTGWFFQGTAFTGVFDGNGHTISHLTMSGGSFLGLFGLLGSWDTSAGEVSNLGLVDVNIIGSGEGVSGLVGGNWGSIVASHSSGAISGMWYVGGLVGMNFGSVSQCYSTGTVTGEGPVGGLVGGNYWLGGIIGASYSSGVVSGTGSVGMGGLVGSRFYVSVTPWPTRSPPPVFNCFWDIETSGQTTSDGGTGKTTAEMQTAKTFLDAGWHFVGETANGSKDIWKIAEGMGYPRLAWEKYSGGTGEPNDPYQIATAADLIALGSEPNDYDKHFLLTAHIDLDPNLPGRKVFDKAVIAPAGNSFSFRGVFDGNSHTISHLTIRSGGFSGLFGALGAGAVVKKLAVVDVNIAGSGDWVGGLAGGSWGGSVDQCYSTGVVDGGECVGGLLGGSDEAGTVTRCYSAGTVRGWWYVGGLVAFSNGRVTECYSAAAVDGSGYVGGLVGSNGGNIISTYSRGSVRGTDRVGGLVGHNRGSISSSFWDIQTSGQATSDGGTGKTTTEMQTAKTFLDAGWDFVEETANGTDDIWWILEGKDYPRLWWEQGDGASP